MALIEPRTLKGFRDYLPDAMIPREWLIDTARRVYRSYGFSPIDTPALEYEEILTGKGGTETDKQLYRFEDHGGRKVALRFDLTVPLARFAAQHIGELGVPFKRYHIATVWRGENTQRGRYREFMQCDFDTIGSESIASDIETVLVAHDLMRQLGFGSSAFTIRVNNRKVLQGLIAQLGVDASLGDVLRVLDKLDKVGRDGVHAELGAKLGVASTDANRILDAVMVQGTSDEILAQLERTQLDEVGKRGLSELTEVVRAARSVGVIEPTLRIDLSIARGLDYYTGTVLETTLRDLAGIGSVCSGGRYDDLAQLYTKQRLPGIGASLGLDRLLAAMEELGMIETRRTGASVFLPYFDASRLHSYLKLAADLRAAGIGVEFFPEPKKLDAQLRYADKRGFEFALVVGENEWKSGRAQVKDLKSRSNRDVALYGDGGTLSSELVAQLKTAPRS
jgi:histidyl-tRNA synthetase